VRRSASSSLLLDPKHLLEVVIGYSKVEFVAQDRGEILRGFQVPAAALAIRAA
jgi:hypothetical protein